MTTIAAGEVITAAFLNEALTQFDGYGERTLTSTSNSTSTDIGVLRVSNVDLVGGRAYWIGYTFHPDSATLTDVVRATVRSSTSGDATASSTIVYKSRTYAAVNVGSRHTMCIFIPPSSATYSFLLCFSRNSGASACTMFCDADRGTELFICNVGVVADTGTDV